MLCYSDYKAQITNISKKSISVNCGDYVFLHIFLENWQMGGCLAGTNRVKIGKLSMKIQPKAMVAPNKNQKFEIFFYSFLHKHL